VAEETRIPAGRPLITLETVALLTPAASAMLRILALFVMINSFIMHIIIGQDFPI
jgi:hypothetical protein